MPYVNLNKLLPFYQSILEPLIENNRLVTCPSIFCSDTSKVVHSRLLKCLYRYKQWTVPVHDTWYMPHTLRKFSTLQIALIDKIVEVISQSECFEGVPRWVGQDVAFYMTNLGGVNFNNVKYTRRYIK